MKPDHEPSLTGKPPTLADRVAHRLGKRKKSRLRNPYRLESKLGAQVDEAYCLKVEDIWPAALHELEARKSEATRGHPAGDLLPPEEPEANRWDSASSVRAFFFPDASVLASVRYSYSAEVARDLGELLTQLASDVRKEVIVTDMGDAYAAAALLDPTSARAVARHAFACEGMREAVGRANRELEAYARSLPRSKAIDLLQKLATSRDQRLRAFAIASVIPSIAQEGSGPVLQRDEERESRVCGRGQRR